MVSGWTGIIYLFGVKWSMEGRCGSKYRMHLESDPIPHYWSSVHCPRKVAWFVKCANRVEKDAEVAKRTSGPVQTKDQDELMHKQSGRKLGKEI